MCPTPGKERHDMHNFFWMNIGQIGFGLVVCYLACLANIGDVSAILDTAGAFRLCAVALTVGTLALNTLVLALQARRGI